MGAATQRFTVGDEHTAEAVGSGALPVLATPTLLAWCEAVTCAAIAEHLDGANTSVGTRIQLEHLAPSGVGAQVEVTATTAYVDGRLHRFAVGAKDVATNKVVGAGEVTRVVVDAQKFLERL